ncbi:eIF-2-alpha kinase GCN2 [Melitaea cinxia]|uniref:eIF-2-alpha kinase GCN2 n=1 Tax=Melitaea cinxia TaxID=113334 RepID=UPI001E270D30|nr:eIF-2-alpha kinase GCN2 [Melitaea cinxia]
MSEGTKQERQYNELEALKAIYGDLVVDNRKRGVWNAWRPLDVLITLQPSAYSESVHCQATLQFVCCHNYPDKPPKIFIKKKLGLSDDNATKLLRELEELAKEQCGEVMIFQLAEYTLQFLYEHNKPTLSFYDEMVKEKDEMEKIKQNEVKERENEEIQQVKDEIERISNLNQDRGDMEGDAPRLVYYSDDKTCSDKNISSQDEPLSCNCKNKKTQILSYKDNKTIYVGNCIGHSSNGSTTFLAIDDSGRQIICKKWTFSHRSDFQTQLRQMLWSDFKTMSRLEHNSLVPYEWIDIIESKQTPLLTVHIFRDFVMGTSLKYMLRHSFAFGDKAESLKLLRTVAIGVFGALKELHSVDILHRNIRSETVFLNNNGGVKLVSACLDARLSHMFDCRKFCDRQLKSQDIYAAAQLLLSIVTEKVDQEVPSDLPSSAKDFFSRCLTEDERVQWSAEQLVEHCFLLDNPTESPNSVVNPELDGETEDEDGTQHMHDISTISNGHTRLNVEFETLAFIGRGAFGDVLKVKNKLDGRYYAIKKIKLNPKNVELNKKITREVKLLSRLNHENVVRYFNAWIETTTRTEVEESNVVNKPVKKKEDSLLEVAAKLGQVEVNWSMSDAPGQVIDESSGSEANSDDSDDDEPWFNISPENESSFIQFEGTANSDSMSTEEASSLSLKQALYIQMEFCEKNTLRQAIDNGLYQEHFRAWRLFREVLEGLTHVHQKGMIHRDLKPVNIFLDSSDHVKIGDFGLATKVYTDLLTEDKNRVSQDDQNGLLTGKVGTALYVAPELQQSASKVIYNQKVDIYSLGIILFEMFNPPFNTGTERYTVLSNLRKKEIIMPQEFESEENAKKIHVIRWLLDHDAGRRPTGAELLSSEHVPRAVPEGALSSLLAHTLSQRASRRYQRLIDACLDQKMSLAEDYVYQSNIKPKPMEYISGIKEVVTKVFQRHGAAEFQPQLLTALAERWARLAGAVRVMTASGSVCHLPHDLRLPFAKYTAYNGVKHMRRYVVDRVYRDTERSVKGFHPREIIECAYDIVSPRTDTCWPDAELLVVASKAAIESSLKVKIQINHTELLKILLLSCGVALEKHAVIYPVLVDVHLGRITSLQLQTHLTTLCETNRDITNMLYLMEADVPVKQLREVVGSVVKNNKDLLCIMRQLEDVCEKALAMGCDAPITVAPLLAYNVSQHSGMFWQMSVARQEQRSAKHRSKNLIAAGGRYDNLLDEFGKVARVQAQKKGNEIVIACTSVGFSMSLERMAAILISMKLEVPFVEKISERPKICVYLLAPEGGDGGYGEDLRGAQVARSLWAGGWRVTCWWGPLGEAHETVGCRALLVCDGSDVLVTFCEQNVGNRRSPAASSYLHLTVAMCWLSFCEQSAENRFFREYRNKVQSSKIVEYLKSKLNPETPRTPEYSSRVSNWSESDKSNEPTILVTFVTANEKLAKSTKRQCEAQINKQATAQLAALGLAAAARVRVHVAALGVEAAPVRLLAAHLAAPLHERSLPRAFQAVAELYPKRQNILDLALREMTIIVRQSNQSKSSDEIQIFALFSIPDSLCRLIT